MRPAFEAKSAAGLDAHLDRTAGMQRDGRAHIELSRAGVRVALIMKSFYAVLGQNFSDREIFLVLLVGRISPVPSSQQGIRKNYAQRSST
jgi:hypothetical protein